MPPAAESVTGLLLSGGIDSAILLDQLLQRGRSVVPFYVRSDCVWDACEMAAVGRILSALARPGLRPLVTLEMPLADLYGDHWSISGDGAPDDASPDEAVYLPGRNPLLLIKPVLWCLREGVEELALATLSNNPFDDAKAEFFERFEGMIGAASGRVVRIVRPFEQLSKSRVMELGRRLPLSISFSCLSPVHGMHCGACNKCGERRRAFRRAGIADETEYAQERRDRVDSVPGR